MSVEKLNKGWHEKNRMPDRPTMKERIKWHLGHVKNCGCRPIPNRVLEEIKKQSIGITKQKQGKKEANKPVFEPRHKAVLDSLLLNHPDVAEGKMFGYPAYYVNRKLFTCVYGEAIGVKVPEELANQLLSRPHITPFQPMGKPKMREWIQINRKRSSDYEKDMEIFEASINFVKKLSKR
jgi:predicted DNA-binding protein (MmcQ/YjbR family)